MRTLLLLASASMTIACGSSAKPEGKYPPRAAGCEVRVYFEGELPSYTTDNIGTVQASCDESVTDDECMRELQDQACKLGADTIWGVNERATLEYGKKKFSGRAAHQR